MSTHLLTVAALVIPLACAPFETAAATASPLTEHARRLHQEAALKDAATFYRAAKWGEAFDRMSALADAGHPEAARIALFMRIYGPQMYGRYWRVEPEQEQRWERVVATTAQPAEGGARPYRRGATVAREETR